MRAHNYYRDGRPLIMFYRRGLNLGDGILKECFFCLLTGFTSKQSIGEMYALLCRVLQGWVKSRQHASKHGRDFAYFDVTLHVDCQCVMHASRKPLRLNKDRLSPDTSLRPRRHSGRRCRSCIAGTCPGCSSSSWLRKGISKHAAAAAAAAAAAVLTLQYYLSSHFHEVLLEQQLRGPILQLQEKSEEHLP